MGDEPPGQWREFLSRHRSHSFPALPISKTRCKLARPLAGKPSAIGRASHFKRSSVARRPRITSNPGSGVGLLASRYILLVAGKGSLLNQKLRKRSQAGPRNNFQNAAAKYTCDDYFLKEADSQQSGGNRYTVIAQNSHFGKMW
ncbi:hypothetical protein TNCV_866321 [Trichonephila clavipes]|nr:hypothetical protein TNCV_866321 [Trichonephila clavipes]